MSEKGNKSNIVNNFRKFFEEKLQGNLSEKTTWEFWNSLRWLCQKFNYSKNRDNCEDIASMAFENILKYGMSFWQSLQDKSETEKNKRIYGYLKEIIINNIFENNDRRYDDLLNLNRHIKRELNNLLQDGFLVINKGKYSLNNNSPKNSDCDIEEVFEFYEIFSNTQISSKKVNSLLKKIFTEYLENCEVNNSVISEIFFKFIGFSSISFISIDDEDEEDNKKITLETKDLTTEEMEKKELIGKAITNSKKVLGEKFELLAKLFLLKFYANYTFVEISSFINVSKSTVENYIKNFIGSLGLDKHFTMEEFVNYSNILYEMLADEINFELED